MNIQTYNDMTLEVLDMTPTKTARSIIRFACDLTQKKTDDLSEKKLTDNLAKYLIKAEHTSVFEHVSIVFLARGISRSLLAQLTRQRMFSFTSASQHYQDYRDYPVSLRPGWDTSENILIAKYYRDAVEHALNRYIDLINLGELPEEARQVLPNGCTVNLVFTANARSMAQFLRQRLCKRNVSEMLIFAQAVHHIGRNWLPEIFDHIGPPCIMDEACNQGKLSCKD